MPWEGLLCNIRLNAILGNLCYNFGRMKMKKCSNQQIMYYVTLIILSLFLSCSKNGTEPKPKSEYTLGKNYYTTTVDDTTREYYVHVPVSYDAGTPAPVVFMLHAASGSGEEKYNNSGWMEVGEAENILTVFPTALKYWYTEPHGFPKYDTRWNSYPPKNMMHPGQNPKDDVKFLRQVIAELLQRFYVDSKRIYMVGFSSGAQMTFRCAVEMSDLLAAVVESGATHPVDTVFTPRRNLPITFQLGNSDDTWFGDGVSWSLSLFDSALTHLSICQQTINVHANSFDFETTYTLSGDTNSVIIATFKGIPNVGNRQFNFAFIKDMEHGYPNGINHPLKGAEINWAWLKQYSLL